MKTTIKSNRAKIAALIFTGLAFLASLALFSCSNFSDGSDSSVSASADGKTYVSFSAQSVDGTAKTIQPGASAAYLSALTDISVTGSLSGGAEQGLISAATYSAFTSASSIQIEPGDWTFTITAKLEGVDFGATTTKTIQFGTVNAIEFALKANVTYGGLEVDVTFAGAAPSKAVATLCKQNKTTQIDQATITDFGAGGAPTFTYERVLAESTGLAAGTYWLNFDFYRTGVSEPVNSFGNYVRIVNGITSKADFTLDLNEVYALSYAYYLNGVKVTDPDTIAQLQAALAVGANLPNAYSRKSEINLPSFSYSGYDFMGWYQTNSAIAASQISKIQKGAVGAKTLCAFFKMTSVSGSIQNDLPDNLVFVANSMSGGASTNDGTESKPLDSIEHAVEKIHQIVQGADPVHDATEDWAIVLLSDLSGAQKVPEKVSGQNVANDYLHLTIASKSSDDVKTINGGFSDTAPTDSNSGTTLTIEPYNFTVLQCVNITGGYAQNGGGVKFSGRDLHVKQGAQIYGNKATNAGAGIYAYTASTVQYNSVYVYMQGGIVGGDAGQGNVYIGDGSSGGYGGGVALYGRGAEGVTGSNVVFFYMESGSVKGNKASKGAGIYGVGATIISINDGSISNNTTEGFADGAGGGIYADNLTDRSVTISGGTVSSNTAAKGGGIYANKTKYNMSGGTVTGNTATSGDGAGLYFYTNNESFGFTLDDDAYFGANDYVCFPDTTPTKITAMSSLRKPGPIATLQLASYTPGVSLVTGPSKYIGEYAFAQNCAKIAILPDSNGDEWKLKVSVVGSNNEGILSRLNPITFYVKQDGLDSNGGTNATDDSLKTIKKAIAKISEHQSSTPETEYVIKVVGMLTDKQSFNDVTAATFPSDIDTITIEGYNGLNAGVPQDGIDVSGSANNTLPAMIISFDDHVEQVVLRNLKITGGNRGGLNVGGYATSPTCSVVLGEGTQITGNNSDNPGAGVAVESGCSLTMTDGSKISGNKSKGNGGGVMLNANTVLSMSGGEISGNVAGDNGGTGVGSGVYVGGSGSSGDGRVYLGGNALIASDNDVYLSVVATSSAVCHSLIYIESELNNDYVATLTPKQYEAGQPLIYRANSLNPFLSMGYDKFAVTAQSDGSTWALDENGKLVQTGSGNGGGGSGSVPTGFVQVTGSAAEAQACDYGNASTTINAYVGKNLVTQEEYESLMTYYGVEKGGDYARYTPEGDKSTTPAYFVSWADVVIYCNLLSKRDNLEPVYSIGGETDPDRMTGVMKNSSGKYYFGYDYDADSSEHEVDLWDWDDDSNASYDLSKSGWRVADPTEYMIIANQNVANSLGIVGSSGILEWCNVFGLGNTMRRYFCGDITATVAQDDTDAFEYARHTGHDWYFYDSNSFDYVWRKFGFRLVRNAQ